MASGVGKINDSGVPAATEYLVGGGEVMLASLTSAGMPKSYRKIGNCPTVSMGVTSETYEHMSTQGAIPIQDASVPISMASVVKFECENLSADNLAAFFLGDAAAYTNPAKSAGTDVVQIANADIVKEAWYQIHDANGDPVFGITAVNSLVLESSAGTPQALTITTDYLVDAVGGKFFLNDSANVDTIIAAGATDGKIQATWTLDAAASDVDSVQGMTSSVQNVAMQIKSKNAIEDGEVIEYHFHKVNLSPDGDLGIIGTEAAKMGFTAQIQSNAAFDNNFDVYRVKTQS